MFLNPFSKKYKKVSVTNKFMKKWVSLHYALKWFFVFSEKQMDALLKNGHTFSLSEF